MIIELIKFFVYSISIVLISKYILVSTIRKLAETLNLKPKIVGNISGYATSVPELMTICVSSFSGLMSTTIINVISSNIINCVQYVSSIFFNKNQSALKNKAIKIDLILVLVTIIMPIFLFVFNIDINIVIVPVFIMLYILFIYLNTNAHKLYLRKEDLKLESKIEKEEKWERNNKKKVVKYILYLFCTGILLFAVGELLGDTLKRLCDKFHVSQTIMGILLGIITSIPELITFFESQKYYRKMEEKFLGVVEATNNLFISNILNLFVIESIGIIILYCIA